MMNLYEKINKIMSEIEYLKKDKKAEFGTTKYNFLSEAKTTSVFRDKLIENKIVLIPIHAQETKDDKVTHGIYTYRMVNVEDPTDFIDIMTTGQGHDSTDKGSGKASSYAYKYLLWRTFAIPSGDDPDQITSAEIEAAEAEKLKAYATAEAALYACASELGLNEMRISQTYKVKYGKPLDQATPEEIYQAIDDMKKKAAANESKA